MLNNGINLQFWDDSGQELLGSFFFGAGEEVLGMAFFDDMAIFHKEYMVGHIAGKTHFVGHDNHGHTLCSQLLHDSQYVSNQFWVQGRCRFIKEDNIGFDSDGSGDADALLLSPESWLG